ncbi:phosphoribosylamine--glycine ligase [Vallitalea longa]|uniref:Phosphoribosylamine--glycine ligase n=1 Tax=Vallitalea longa TaxID=2936439 RepID=A0A9W5YHG4_9FIRM|nr:phosphoribosylamine--glycine ligase [Vallitalea longa]GKX32004.1 phosphoribosylamine--glycine ligase [Vallitalea longa]
MNILVVGSGGREHAIIWKLSKSKRVDKIYCAPGNAGISELAECVNVGATDIEGLLNFALCNSIDLTVVGMDDPLMLGIVDAFQNKGLKIFGPRQNAAMIEGSKIFSKHLMKKYNIPTAEYIVMDDVDSANDYIKECQYPIVIKADGLALGKGVLICSNYNEAQDAVNTIMIDKKFGKAGNKIVIEEFLTGPEVSVLSFCDGEHIIPMVSAQDHKRAFDNDEGLNTGGMGTFSPSKYYTEEIHNKCVETIYEPSLKAMKAEGRTFTGIMFFGLMLTENGPKLLEYNARFGDPEAQVVLPRLQTDLVDIFEYAIDGRLNEINVQWDDNAAVCVILASGGYPVKYEKGYEIKGLDLQKNKDDLVVFHAGTKKVDNKIITNGGRVLGLTAIGKDIDEARDKAYQAVDEVDFTNKHYRRDIGIK